MRKSKLYNVITAYGYASFKLGKGETALFKANLFKAAIAANSKTTKEVAEAIGVNEATLYRKISGKSDFTRNEIQLIRQFLSLSADEIDNIFFAA